MAELFDCCKELITIKQSNNRAIYLKPNLAFSFFPRNFYVFFHFKI